jgi:spore photoproduct lyase
MRFPIEQVWIDDEARGEPLTDEILGRLDQAQVRILRGGEVSEANRALGVEADPLRRGKRILKLLAHKGPFLKPCPGTREYVCCGLQILHVGQGCPMDCRYCALQVYFNRPSLELFVNTGDLLDELGNLFDAGPGKFHRICTGEFTDSLALDPLTGFASTLVTFFSKQPRASLELKTKTDFIEPLLDLDPHGRVVLSFSMNSKRIAQHDEMRAAPLTKRLSAAERAQGRGYRLGFHFDPIIPYPGWAEEYAGTIDEIFARVEPAAIAWISLGVLRYVPELKETVRSRFGTVPYFHDEFLRGLDGKSRLPVSRRIHVYRVLADRIRRHSPDARIYLCMESPHVWKESLGLSMTSTADLSAYLDEAID